MGAVLSIDSHDIRTALNRTGELKIPLLVSVMVHVAAVIIGIVGLPYIKPFIPVIEDSIVVELVTSEDVAKEESAPPPKENQRRIMPQNLATEPPRAVSPVRPEKRDVKPTAPVKPVAPPSRKPDLAKPKPPEPKEAPPEENTEQQQEQFQSLLRNLAPDEPQPQQKAEDEQQENQQQSSLLTRFSQTVTAGEMNALRTQLANCWSVQAGARFAEDLVVPLRIFVNPDRTVRDVQIVENIRYNTDSFYRAAADSAIRAVWRCNPLELPPQKHELWKTIVIRFDPGDML